MITINIIYESCPGLFNNVTELTIALWFHVNRRISKSDAQWIWYETRINDGCFIALVKPENSISSKHLAWYFKKLFSILPEKINILNVSIYTIKKPAHGMKVKGVLNLGFFTPQTKRNGWLMVKKHFGISSTEQTQRIQTLCLTFSPSLKLLCFRAIKVSTGLLNLLLTSIYISIYAIPVTNVRVFMIIILCKHRHRCWCFSWFVTRHSSQGIVGIYAVLLDFHQ